MYDLLDSVQTVEEAIQLAKETIYVHGRVWSINLYVKFFGSSGSVERKLGRQEKLYIKFTFK